MARAIFEVYVKIVDANGSYNTLNGYPKVFDSNNYDNDPEKAKQRAYGEWHDVLGAMCKRDDRQAQIAMIISGNDGRQLELATVGVLDELPE